MDEKLIRKIISEEIEKTLVEAAEELRKAPEKFTDFRIRIASASKTAGAPSDFIDEISDIDYEAASGISGALWGAWSEYERELRSIMKMKPEEQEFERWQVFLDAVHQAIVMSADAYFDNMNYEPGRKPMMRFQPQQLADRVVRIIDKGSMLKSDSGSLRKVRGDIDELDVAEEIKGFLKKNFRGIRTAFVKAQNEFGLSKMIISSSDPNVFPRLMDEIPTMLTKLGAVDVKPESVELEGFSAKASIAGTRIMKTIFVDLEPIKLGKGNVYINVEQLNARR
jgi:hypothetical protein